MFVDDIGGAAPAAPPFLGGDVGLFFFFFSPRPGPPGAGFFLAGAG